MSEKAKENIENEIASKVTLEDEGTIALKVKKKLSRGFDNFNNLLGERKKLLIFLGMWSVLLNYFLEASLRKNLITGFTQIFTQPFVFFYNALIIFCSFSVILFIKRRLFYFTIASVAWLAVAITNFVMLMLRNNTPFNASDFRVLKSAFDIIDTYLTLFELIMVLSLIAMALVALIITFIISKHIERNFYFAGSAFGVIVSLTVGTTLIFSSTVDTSHFSNLPNAYREYGFAYSFLSSILDRGIDKPNDYDSQKIQQVMNIVGDDDSDGVWPDEEKTVATEKTPNIVFLQLESFYDPDNITGLTFNTDPIPVFRNLEKECMSGFLTVPSIGAGTANTEFEVITGMDIDHFGVAEYPYLSILQNNTCESLAYIMKENGYASHAIHNHTGTFYDRHIVFPNLGFDTYTSIENMTPIVRNELDWAKDSMLLNEIMEVMNYTPDQADAIYTISVQPHGKYPATMDAFNDIYNENNPAKIKVYGNENSAEKPGVDYWVNQVSEVDSFIGALIQALESFEEPTVLVMFGDHLPAFDLENWTLDKGNLYQTTYVIWSNFEMPDREDRDLYSFQLSSYVMKIFDIENGYMNKLHQHFYDNGVEYEKDPLYYNEMHILQYDMLYGEKYLYNGEKMYMPSNIRYGYEDIVIKEVKPQGNTIYIYGEGFSHRYSQIYVNGAHKATTFVKEGCISADNVRLNKGDEIKVVQTTTDHFHIKESNKYIYEN